MVEYWGVPFGFGFPFLKNKTRGVVIKSYWGPRGMVIKKYSRLFRHVVFLYIKINILLVFLFMLLLLALPCIALADKLSEIQRPLTTYAVTLLDGHIQRKYNKTVIRLVLETLNYITFRSDIGGNGSCFFYSVAYQALSLKIEKNQVFHRHLESLFPAPEVLRSITPENVGPHVVRVSVNSGFTQFSLDGV